MTDTTPETRIIEDAYREALRVVQGCLGPGGMKASAAEPGYPQVWSRDTMITLLGAVLPGDSAIHQSLEDSFQILAEHQTPLGQIPNNVHLISLRPNFQAYADSGLWFIIGAANYYQRTGSADFLERYYPVIRKTLSWYEYQDVDQTGLITMAEGADWEDLFAVRGKGLYVNILHYIALKKAADMTKDISDAAEGEIYTARAAQLKKLINRHFWYGGDPNYLLPQIEPSLGNEIFSREGLDSLGRSHSVPEKTLLKDRSYYLPYLTFRGFGEWFDSLGNLLAILSGIAGEQRSDEIINLIKDRGLDRPGPLKSISPPVFPGDPDWRYYYLFNDLNRPHCYHNGGIWPFIGGFYVAALVKANKFHEADKALVDLARLNRAGRGKPWEFNEWFEGEAGRPMGMAGQAWSAGMFLFAYYAVKRRRTPFF